jgi:glutathione S-transferase
MPAGLQEFQHDLRLTGLALAACEKSGQIVYERGLRPPEKMHQPWVTRATVQLLGAYGAIEQKLSRKSLAVTSSTMSRASVTVAAAWHFTQQVLPEVIAAKDFPNQVAFSAAMEALPEFWAAPYGEGTYRHGG